MKASSRKAARRIQTPTVVLDTVGLVRRRNGGGTLRLKIVGPVAKLGEIQLQEGDRLRVHAHTLTVRP